MTLTEFLLARIAEDESSSRWGRLHDDPDDPDGLTKILRWDDGRVRTECEAKLRIVESYRWYQENAGRGSASIDALLLAERHAKWLALPYADHPHYRQEWKP